MVVVQRITRSCRGTAHIPRSASTSSSKSKPLRALRSRSTRTADRAASSRIAAASCSESALLFPSSWAASRLPIEPGWSMSNSFPTPSTRTFMPLIMFLLNRAKTDELTSGSRCFSRSTRNAPSWESSSALKRPLSPNVPVSCVSIVWWVLVPADRSSFETVSTDASIFCVTSAAPSRSDAYSSTRAPSCRALRTAAGRASSGCFST